MARFNIPSSVDPYIYKISDFLGIDLVSDEIIDRRASSCENMTNRYGLMKKRYPIKVMNQFINLLDCFRYSNNHVLFIYRERLLNDQSEEYWKFAYADDFKGTNMVTIKTITTAHGLDFVYHKIKFGDQWLLTFGNLNSYVPSGYLSSIPPHIFKDENNLQPLDPFVPTTTISRLPNGTGGTSNEDVNLLTPFRKTSFWCKTAATEFKLEPGTITDDLVTAEILQSDGSYITVEENDGFTVDRDTNTVTFDTAQGPTPIDGMDNVIIKYAIELEGNQRYTQPKDFIVYGYENSDRLFVNFGTNTDMYSASNDCTYFPSNNYQVIGSSSPITGYAVINNRLITFKDDLNSVWIRTGYLIDGEEVFPTNKTMSQQQIVKVASYNNRTVVLTKMGIYEIVVGSSINFYERSMYIRPFFKNLNHSNASIYWFDNNIYLLDNENNIMYESFISFKTTTNFDEDYQWEWYKHKLNEVNGSLFHDIEYINNKTIYSLFILNHEYLVKFDSEVNHNEYIDEVPHVDYYRWRSDRPVMWVDKQPIDCHWESGFVRVSKRFDKSFTIKNFYLQTKSLIGDRFKFGYKLPSGEKLLRNYLHNTYRTFPSLIDVKRSVKNKAWIKFLVENTVKYNQINVENLWKFTSNGEDTFGENHGTPTDVTFDSENGALFNGTTSQIQCINNIQLGPMYLYASNINIYPDFTLGVQVKLEDLPLNEKCYIIQSTSNQYVMRYELYFMKTETTLKLHLDLYIGYQAAGLNPSPTIECSIDLPYDFEQGTIELRLLFDLNINNYMGRAVHVKIYNESVSFGRNFFIEGYPLHVNDGQMIIGKNFKGYIKNLFFIQQDITVDDYDSLDTTTFDSIDTENQYDVPFDEIQLKWKHSGKYKGD